MFHQFNPDRPVAIIGAGVMGTKVAWACARAGLDTRLFDVEEGKAAESRERALSWSSGAERAAVEQHLDTADSLESALRNVQLVFENVPEVLEIKHGAYREIEALLPHGAYLGSNASSLLCSQLSVAVNEPERFFCLNFNDPRTSRLVELMTAADTAGETAQFAQDWAAHIRMIPVHVRKEQLGYSMNRLWRVIKKEVLRQIAEGYSTPEDIDRAWMLNWGQDMGPCGMMDDIGLHSIVKVEEVYFRDSGDESDRPPQFLREMVERGEWGVATSKGFYNYPDPAYRQSGFLEGT